MTLQTPLIESGLQIAHQDGFQAIEIALSLFCSFRFAPSLRFVPHRFSSLQYLTLGRISFSLFAFAPTRTLPYLTLPYLTLPHLTTLSCLT